MKSSVAQAGISFIKVGEIPLHFKTGWVDKNPFTATTNKHWWPSRHHWVSEEGAGVPLIHWRCCVSSPLSLCLYLHWYLISLSFRCLPQQPALCVASGTTSQGDHKISVKCFYLFFFLIIKWLLKVFIFCKSFPLVKPFNIFLPPEQFVSQARLLSTARLLRICISVIKI